jgi:hypothetical protein
LVQSDLLYAATTRYSYTILLSLRIIHNRSIPLTPLEIVEFLKTWLARVLYTNRRNIALD